MNKKASLAEKLVTIIIVVAVVTMIILTVQRFYAKADDKQAEVLCQESVAARAASQIQIGPGELSPFPLLCRTIDGEAEGERDEIKEEFARMAERCWWMFGEGRYEEILKDNYWDLLGFEDPENVCFICYAAVTQQDEIEGGAIGAREMLAYLNDNNHSRISGPTYLEYIQGYGGPGNFFMATSIEPRSSYGVAFLSKGEEGAFAGEVQGVVLDAASALDIYQGGSNRETSSIVIDNLRHLQEQGNCISDIGGR